MYVCAILKDKAADFFQPLQFGAHVACQVGEKKIIHCVRGCIEKHWLNEFCCFKVDMRIAFY